MEVTIEKGVPAPDSISHGRRLNYPLDKMDVGDSFFITGDIKLLARAAESCRKYGLRKGRKYTSRRENGGLRVWRLG